MVACAELAGIGITIPEFSLHWVRALARYLEYSGDDATAAELLPAAADVLAAVERYRAADGLLHKVPSFVWIDWAQVERGEVTTALDCIYAAALDDYAFLSSQLGNERAAAGARANAQRT